MSEAPLNASLFLLALIGTTERCSLIKQIGRVVIPTPTKPLASIKARMLDTPKALCPLEVRPTSTFHANASYGRSTVRARMTIGLGSSLSWFSTQFPSRANGCRATRLCAPRMRPTAPPITSHFDGSTNLETERHSSPAVITTQTSIMYPNSYYRRLPFTALYFDGLWILNSSKLPS